jgi:hypothetical protein
VPVSVRNSLDLARHLNALGYRRHWMVKHHNLVRHPERGDGGGAGRMLTASPIPAGEIAARLRGSGLPATLPGGQTQ